MNSCVNNSNKLCGLPPSRPEAVPADTRQRLWTRRGPLKIKPVHTLDPVVLRVEWGSGRRQGKLSNIHLGARDPATGGYVMLGKTFEGMTDAMLDWQTVRALHRG
jgi:ATP-dependent DNA ligase